MLNYFLRGAIFGTRLVMTGTYSQETVPNEKGFPLDHEYRAINNIIQLVKVACYMFWNKNACMLMYNQLLATANSDP